MSALTLDRPTPAAIAARHPTRPALPVVLPASTNPPEPGPLWIGRFPTPGHPDRVDVECGRCGPLARALPADHAEELLASHAARRHPDHTHARRTP